MSRVDLLPHQTEVLKQTEDKTMIRCFKNGDFKIYVDEKLLKNFDLPNCTFKGIGATAGLFVYENEIMVGFVLPIRLKNS